jgi:hypothetical protein
VLPSSRFSLLIDDLRADCSDELDLYCALRESMMIILKRGFKYTFGIEHAEARDILGG